jgi:hypothetical protein
MGQATYTNVFIRGLVLQNTKIVIPTNATFQLSSSVVSVDEGTSVTITLDTTLVPDNSSIAYTISGISLEDVSLLPSLTGVFTILGNTASVTFNVVADKTFEGPETLTLTLDNYGTNIDVTVNDTSYIPDNATFALSSSVSTVNEGVSVTVTLDTTNLADGAVLTYTMYGDGITANDISLGSLTGSFTIQNNTASVTFTVVADGLLEGAELLTLSLDHQGYGVSVNILDTSRIPANATFSLTSSVLTVDEGYSITIYLATTLVANTTTIPYTITGSGITASDLGLTSLTGEFTVINNAASVTFNVAADETFEGTESLTLTLDDYPSVDVSASIMDTSYLPANATFSLASSYATVTEGYSLTITLTTTNVPDGIMLPYTITGTGVTAADLTTTSLSGVFTVYNNSAFVNFTVFEDQVTEGNETLTLSLNDFNASVSVDLLDSYAIPANATFLMSSSATQVSEGYTFTVTLNTQNIANGTILPYTITGTGITNSDFVSGTLTGSFVIQNNTASVQLTTATDGASEGTESMTLTLDGGYASTTVNIQDTSFADEVVYSSPGTYTFTAPAGVTSVSAVCVGGGGGACGATNGNGGGGGGLGWKNNIAVTPGQSYTVVVGSGGSASSVDVDNATSGGNSYFISLSTVAGYGGGRATIAAAGAGGSKVGDGGGNGGSGSKGGGGAGGYSGNGGGGGGAGANGGSGAGGAAGGGSGGQTTSPCAGGGGTGLYGQGENGRGGAVVLGGGAAGYPGLGGSRGSAGLGVVNGKGGYVSSASNRADGGFPGGAGGGISAVSFRGYAGNGASGAVRIMWGSGRSFPSNAKPVEVTTVTGEQSFTDAGSYTFTVPSNVYNVSVLCIGGGAGGIVTLTPGNNGSDSYFGNYCRSGGGQAAIYASYNLIPRGGWPVICDSGYNGADGPYATGSGTGNKEQASPGGGAAGAGVNTVLDGGTSARFFAGGGGVGIGNTGANGAGGAFRDPSTSWKWGVAGTNGGGGSGGSWYNTITSIPVGTVLAYGGGGGSGGTAGGNSIRQSTTIYVGGDGGLYGGAGGGSTGSNLFGAGGGAKCWTNNIPVYPGQQISVVVGSGGTGLANGSNRGGNGGRGAVRVIWGPSRSFPSNS